MKTLILIVTNLLATTALAQTTKPANAYLAVVRKSADALLANGRDTMGQLQSAMILSVLDRRTAKPLTELPKPPDGIRSTDRTGPHGSNASVQMDLYRVLIELGRLTGDAKYATAGRDGIVDCLKITQHPTTGLIAWGEHLYWNCLTDTYEKPPEMNRPIHEPKRDLIFFDLWYTAAPEQTIKYARGLWDHQIFDQSTGDFSRHTQYDLHRPEKGMDFPKEGSFFIDTWARAYEKTKDPVFTQAIRVLAKRYLDRTTNKDLIEWDSSGRPDRANFCVPLWMMSMSLECHEAIPRVDEETAKLLRELETRSDRGFLGMGHDPDGKGFVAWAATDTGVARPRNGTDGYSRPWSMRYGIHMNAMFALLANTRQEQLKTGPIADAYRKLIVQTADLYARTPARGDQNDVWAGEYGIAVFTEIAAYRLTNDRKYLAAAQTLADDTIAALWAEAALPRASTKVDHYEGMTYADTLMLSLLALHEHVAGLPPQVPVSDLVR
jgi:hypothetical protein